MAETRYPTIWWTRLDDGRIRCDVCPRACALHEGQTGLCFVRMRAGDRTRKTTTPISSRRTGRTSASSGATCATTRPRRSRLSTISTATSCASSRTCSSPRSSSSARSASALASAAATMPPAPLRAGAGVPGRRSCQGRGPHRPARSPRSVCPPADHRSQARAHLCPRQSSAKPAAGRSFARRPRHGPGADARARRLPPPALAIDHLRKERQS